MGLGKTYSTKYLLDSNNSSGVSGQVLSTTSTGIDWVDANTVPGTGLWLANGNNIYNSNSGNVGIGETGPSAKLHVQGDTIIRGVLRDDNVNLGLGGAVKVKASNTVSDQYVAFGTTPSGSSGAATFTEKMRVTSAGNVGIGTDAPNNLLNLQKNVADGDVAIYIQNNNSVVGSTDETASVKFAHGNDNVIGYEAAKIVGGKEGDFESSIPNIKGNLQFYTAGGTSLTPSVNNVERMRITSSGNVGIGTTSPGTINSVAFSGVGLHVKSGTLGRTITEGSSEASYLLNNSGASVNQRIKYIQSTAGNLAIGSFNDNGLARPQITVLNSGDVGIGTTSPVGDLNLVGGQQNIVLTNTAADGVAGLTISRIIGQARGYSNNLSVMQSIDFETNPSFWYKGDIVFKTNNTDGTDTSVAATERMRVTAPGGISFGSTGTAYGTSGQVLTSAGNASPTWTTPTTGTVTGSGTATQVAFWDTSTSLSGDSNLYWDATNDYLGIGDATPNSRLKVSSGSSQASIFTVDINHARNNADVATTAMRINMDLSGADTTTADRTNYGLFVDVDSSANGDAANEHRIQGVGSTVNFTGFTDVAHGGKFSAESNYTGAKTQTLTGVHGNAVHDTNSTSGGVSNMYGVYGSASIQDLGDVDNAYGGYFISTVSTNRGASNVGSMTGVIGEIQIDKPDTITYGTMRAVVGIIDNNETTFPTFGTQYLFKGDYQGTRGGNAYGVYCEGDKHYFEGNVGIGVTGPAVKLHVNGTNASVGTIGTPKNNWYTSAYNGIQVGDGTTLWGRAGDSHFSGNYYVSTLGSGGGAQDTYINSIYAHDFWLDNSSGSLKYRNAVSGTAGDAISFSTRFVVLNNGNFGIGTTTPLVKLQVYGNPMPATGDAASVEDIFTLYRNGSASVWAGGATLALGRYSTGGGTSPKSRLDFKLKDAAGSNTALPETTVMTMQSNGNVGIGVVNPETSRLLVRGSTNDSTSQIFQAANLAGATRYAIRPDGDNKWYKSDNSLSMTLTSAGNVGIGDTGPTVKLQVSTDSPSNNVAALIGDGWVGNSSYHKEGGLLLISGTSQDATQTGAGIAFQTRNTQNTNYWKSSMIMDRDGAIRFTLGGAGTVAGSEDFTILSGGNVGIGVTNPGNKLRVEGSVRVNSSGNGQIFFGTGSLNKIELDGTDMKLSSGGLAPTITMSNQGLIKFGLYGLSGQGTPANLLGVDGSGNVVKTNSFNLILDDTPAASTTSGSGNIVNWSVSETVTAGTLYTVKSNGGWTTTDADIEARSTGMLAIALGSNATAGMLLQGFFYKASHGFTIGLPLYISNTAGAFSTTRPTGTNDYVRIIGYATSANYIYFDPDKTWVKLQ